MIKLETVHIEEIRGIRALDVDLKRKTFAISGPNGSGKSGVIDAIEFGLTGEIKRLTGSGTKGLSLAEHGPHVDKVKFSGASFVELRVFLPVLGKSATVKRTIKTPKKPEITPNEPEVCKVLDAVAEHPEITLSRRDIIRFILVEPAKRSQEIQTLLKLDELGATRAALNTTQNRLQRDYGQAQASSREALRTLMRHLQIERPNAEQILAAVNEKRTFLGLKLINMLSPDTQLDAGLESGGASSRFNKVSALTDVSELTKLTSALNERCADDIANILDGIKKIECDPALFTIIQQRTLIEKGLELLDGPACPLCDLPWEDEDHLRGHLNAKLVKSKEANAVTGILTTCGSRLSLLLTEITGKLATAIEIANAKEVDAVDEAMAFDAWKTALTAFKAMLSSIDGLIGQKERFERGWLKIPGRLTTFVTVLEAKVQAVPDQSSIIAAQTYLSTSQLRHKDFRNRKKNESKAEKAARSSKRAYDIYCKVMEDELNALYEDVQNDFSTLYRELNEDDEATFTAKFTPSEGALALDVNFYERGLFPPGAYHSEGHQDGMGVCLYLALMKRLLGSQFSFALLDDVVMSVDAGHRYQFCKLLKAHFTDTQFVLTTHDKLWAEQMKSAGLVTAKTSLAFLGWSVDTGPLVESSQEIWDEIDAALGKGKVEIAAMSLRRHLEYFATHQCDLLGAQPQFRSDGKYELGELLPAVLNRMKVLLGKATDAAQSWGNDKGKQAAVALKKEFANSSGAYQVEQWAVNSAVHYNKWANFGKKDFEPVVIAFKELRDLFHCKTCDSWLYAKPRMRPEALRCTCGELNFNLNQKTN